MPLNGEGALAEPKIWDPLLQVLAERGSAHEQNYLEHLTKAGLDVVRIDGFDVTGQSVMDTLTAMRRGVPAIAQMAARAFRQGKSTLRNQAISCHCR